MQKYDFFNKLKENAFSGYWQKRIISELEFQPKSVVSIKVKFN